MKDSEYYENVPYEPIVESKDPNYKRDLWDAAIGLQKVDGLEVSDYLRNSAQDNIHGLKSYAEIESDLCSKYEKSENSVNEADIVAVRIAQTLETGGFALNPICLLGIHEQLFRGVFEPGIVGKFRGFNLSKKEQILFGDTVKYGDYHSIKESLKFYMEEEEQYCYSAKLTDNDIEHLSAFTRHIWQTHPFGEGNTRTTAVFIELYLRTLGYSVDNSLFKENSLFFRNALVRSCYSSQEYDAHPTYSFLNHFYKNLLCDENYILDNYDLFISNKEDINYEYDKSTNTRKRKVDPGLY